VYVCLLACVCLVCCCFCCWGASESFFTAETEAEDLRLCQNEITLISFIAVVFFAIFSVLRLFSFIANDDNVDAKMHFLVVVCLHKRSPHPHSHTQSDSHTHSITRTVVHPTLSHTFALSFLPLYRSVSLSICWSCEFFGANGRAGCRFDCTVKAR